MKDYSRFYRWILLITSLLTIGLLVAAALGENYFSQWLMVQRAYRKILNAKATDDRGREIAGNFKLELKQISLPALGTVDRCVTCHNGIDDPRMTDVPNPHRVHPGAILANHPVDRFGCTICHQGQGAATNFKDAKAEDAFWDYPLLPANLTQSSCASCHDVNKLPSEEVSLLQEGMKLFEQKSCGSCHKLGGRGGALGPALDNEGAKTRHQLIMISLKPPYTTWRWHQAHFKDPGGVVAGSLMRNPAVSGPQALALTAYMLSLRQRDVPESYLAPDKIEQKYVSIHPVPLTGEQVYQRFCFACHGEGSYSIWNKSFKRFIPAIRGSSLIATATREYLEANIRNGRPGTQMPGWGPKSGGLSPNEISAVVDYLRTGAPAATPITAALPRGDAAHGAALFARNCSGCHGVSGRAGIAPEIGNPTFQQAATDAFIVQTIRNGRRGTAMPAFQRPGAVSLSDNDISDILAFVRGFGTDKTQTAAVPRTTQAPAGGKK